VLRSPSYNRCCAKFSTSAVSAVWAPISSAALQKDAFIACLGQGRERSRPPTGLGYLLYVPSSQELAAGNCPDANNKRRFWLSLLTSATVLCTEGNHIDSA